MFNEYYDAFNSEFKKSVDHMDYEFSKLQTGRASSSLFEDISIIAYGSSQPMKNVAQITIPDNKTVSIKPFDKSILKCVFFGEFHQASAVDELHGCEFRHAFDMWIEISCGDDDRFG